MHTISSSRALWGDRRRAIRLGVAASVALMAVGAFQATPAVSYADSAPVNPADPKTPVTVSSDALPTTQIDGVAWNQLVVGNTVYVAGKFGKARPAGAAPGTSTVTRQNLLAYDLTTGDLKTGFVANLNAQAFALAKSPDGSRIYVGGDFTKVNGIARSRIVALDPLTGTPKADFKPSANASVRAIVATTSTVYLGGYFSTLNGSSRAALGAVKVSGSLNTTWKPVAGAGHVNAMVASPDKSKIVIGGNFKTLNKSSKSGYGLGQVKSTTGANVTFPTNSVVRNAGSNSAIWSLATDSTNVYGTGYVFGSGGNLEGSFSTRWSDGKINWLEDCHGDSYSVFPGPQAVYVAGHPHSCANIPGEGSLGRGFPNMPSGSAQRAIAFSRSATGTVSTNREGNYHNFAGNPAPSLLNFFPQMSQGSFTGQSQAAWTVQGSSDGKYVVYGGEFPRVHSSNQQGLVRFAVKEIAPNKQGPKATGTSSSNPFVLTVSQPLPSQVKVAWNANYDWDNSKLTYSVYRDNALLTTVVKSSVWYNRPAMSYLDTQAPAGTYSYKVTVEDPFGSVVTTPPVSITVP